MQVEPQQRDAHPSEEEQSGSMNLPTSVAERSQVNVMRATMDIQVKVDFHAGGSNEITGTEVRRRDQDPRR
jgi:hypothetical protein